MMLKNGFPSVFTRSKCAPEKCFSSNYSIMPTSQQLQSGLILLYICNFNVSLLYIQGVSEQPEKQIVKALVKGYLLSRTILFYKIVREKTCLKH